MSKNEEKNTLQKHDNCNGYHTEGSKNLKVKSNNQYCFECSCDAVFHYFCGMVAALSLKVPSD